MKPVKVMSIFGVRPEAIKMAPVVKELEKCPAFFMSRVVVTGQHREMLDQVLEHFRIRPDYDLGIMKPRQTLTDIAVSCLAGLSTLLEEERPQIVLVHGDTSSAFIAGLAAFYQKIPVGHVEAGLRTRDKYLPYPEEMNRRLIGALADLHFAPTATARDNLLAEAVPGQNIFVTGNTAIDALFLTARPDYRFDDRLLGSLDYGGRKVIAVDAHRRENFGPPMERICLALRDIARRNPDTVIVYSVHKNPEVEDVAYRLLAGEERVHLCPPVEYPEWANLIARAYLIITDSGGLQEEAPSLGTPVVLLRDVTERPEALAAGTVRMVGTDRERIVSAVEELLRDPAAYAAMAQASNPYGDGRAAERIVDALAYHFGLKKDRPAEFDP